MIFYNILHHNGNTSGSTKFCFWHSNKASVNLFSRSLFSLTHSTGASTFGAKTIENRKITRPHIITDGIYRSSLVSWSRCIRTRRNARFMVLTSKQIASRFVAFMVLFKNKTCYTRFAFVASQSYFIAI